MARKGPEKTRQTERHSGPLARTAGLRAGQQDKKDKNSNKADAGDVPDKRETDISFRLQPVQVAAPRHMNVEVMSRSPPSPFLWKCRKKYFSGGNNPPL